MSRSSASDGPQPADVIARLASTGTTLGVAESLTGGMLMASLTSVPGSSAVLRGGVVAYASDVKVHVLGVERELIESVGVVHPEVAAQMARGAGQLMDATLGVATTGEAGPDSASGEPIGTAFVAVWGPEGVVGRSVESRGDREEVRAAVVREALVLLMETAPGASG